MIGVLRISVFCVTIPLDPYIDLFGLRLDDAIVLRNSFQFLFITFLYNEYGSC